MRRVPSFGFLFRRHAQAGTWDHDPSRKGPRIAVMGNCQARGVAQALRVLAPEAQVVLLPMGRLTRDHRSLAAFSAALRGYDHVFVMPFAGFFPDGGSMELVSTLPSLRVFPGIVFPAFHPDAVYVGEIGSQASTRLLPSPLHTYHSAIALFGFLRGLDRQRIVALFRSDVFERLGYLDMWPLATAELLAYAASVGFPLEAEFVRWSRRGAFMHTFNHPNLSVLGDVAARLLRESGLTPAELPLDAYLADELLKDVVWPVYEPVAARYGVKGSYLFKRRQKRDEAPSLLDLDAFVAESLAVYRKTPSAQLRCQRVEQWAERPDICALFDAA